MAKRPREKWQAEARLKMECMGIGYKELAERIGSTQGTVGQAMCKNYSSKIKQKICDYLGIDADEENVS
ncbi:hypothetical protein [Anaerovorax sp. IOR16]|uniref:hypothetical protein n=1 Tax=Anaerovorax sp. IOR16 TaxID=2773458 RepID=UPI0019D02FBD|nr:hypothetical protein [Anaerovorax sp. IOR16]